MRRGFGAFQLPVQLTEARDGLVYVSTGGMQALSTSLLLFKIPDTRPITVDTGPSVDMSGANIDQIIAQGYVALVSTSSGLFRFTKSPIAVADSAGFKGSYAIIGGPEWIITTARAINQTTGPKWALPVAVGVGALVLYLALS